MKKGEGTMSNETQPTMLNNKSQALRRGMTRALLAGAVLAPALLASGSAAAWDDPPPAPITFTDIAQIPATGISYRRTKSDIDVLYDAIKLKPFMSIVELTSIPAKPRGAPGVALIDYDNDGDLDIYATNGPGTANSLYQNQLVESGNATFVDVAAAAGVAATAQDSTGVCYGDTDNDGDEDMLVLGRMEAAKFYRNNGDGTFTDASVAAGIAQGARSYSSCAMADVDNDGLLDVFVANTFDWSREEAIYSDLYSFSHTNELYHNNGGNSFADVSASSGIHNLLHVPPGDGTISWSAALVDFDQDGDVDIFHADDQGAMPPVEFAGQNRGIVHILANDGAGHFTDITATHGMDHATSWMGLSFGDINCDDHMDYFAVSLGDYAQANYGIPIPTPVNSSQWFYGSASGEFESRGMGSVGATPFGWGNGMVDYDNDADTDIIFYGSLDLGPFITADNPGAVLNNTGCNDGANDFTWDAGATAVNAEFVKRNGVEGAAMGDLNNDGFADVVWVSSSYAPPSIPMIATNWKWTGIFGPQVHAFDATADILPTFAAIGPIEWEWMGGVVDDGYLGVEMNSASNDNKWVKVEVMGSVGLTPQGSVNRDGLGAIVKFKPKNKSQVMGVVHSGGTYASEHSRIQGFGLGDANRGRVEVLWPGGVKNRLYNVEHEEHVLIPEIPCDFSANWPSKNVYKACVDAALNDLKHAGVITHAERSRLRSSALKAYDDEH
jgi:hypothetical protein